MQALPPVSKSDKVPCKHQICCMTSLACCIQACSHANDLRMAESFCLLHAAHTDDHSELQ